ncbi:hypothetical protein O6H91_16G019400 [Diphasiastrum complanatum]|uniref:Uncharacterized protein n=1 Tax=Diphasiastrum complanatum TaxID=34168 RepID=A0ACC2BAA0_DIPCM|nr:hypothetical protein O6H91_16G019400 [Diphasiastrum complanatum]
MKILCNLGIWCISVQRFDATLLSLHVKVIIEALVHAVDNPFGSLAVTFEAFQAVKVLNDRVSNDMKEFSHVWVPPLYRRLLSLSKNERDMAEQILEEIKCTIIPPPPKLMQMVAVDVKETYLSKMKEMNESSAFALVAVRAWGWFVRLLDNHFVENRSLVNEMLIIPQSSFAATSDVRVRIASQIGWRCFIDVAVRCSDVAPISLMPKERENHYGSSLVSPSQESSPRQPSLSYLKLLMKPILNNIEVEMDTAVINATWQTWLHMLNKLGLWVNDPSVFKIVAAPMFELVFKIGPKEGDLCFWDNCAKVFLDYLKCKLLNSSTGSRMFDSELFPDRNLSENISVENAQNATKNSAEISEAVSISPIRWAAWGSIHLEALLQIVAVLWASGLKDLECSKGRTINQSSSMNAALEAWRMVIRGVENDQRDKVRPSDEDVLAVHSLLKVVAQFCSENTQNSSSKKKSQLTWMMIEILLSELRPIILASSFYKLACPLNADEKSFWKDQSKVSLSKGTRKGETQVKCDVQANLGLIKGAESVTPITYLLAIWLEFVFQNQIDDSEEKASLLRIQKLSSAASLGLNSMANFHGKVFILEWLKCFLGCRNKSQRPNHKTVHKQPEKTSTSFDRQNCLFLLEIWKIFSEELRIFIESTNDVPSFEGGPRDSGYTVVYSTLLFPLKLYLHSPFCAKEENLKIAKSILKCDEGCSSKDFSSDKLEMVESCWLNLFDSVSRIASLKRSKYFITRCMFQRFRLILDGLRQDSRLGKGNNSQTLRIPLEFLELFSTAIACALKHVEISSHVVLPPKRERRDNVTSSGGHIHGTATIVEDPYNMKEVLLSVSRFLAISRTEYLLDAQFPDKVVIRVLDSLAALANRLHNRHEALLLLQMISSPLANWIAIGHDTVSPSSLNRSLSAPLQEQLGRVWDGLLACLQTSHPAISFDSNLLAVQAPSLIRFFLIDNITIVNRTLSFWEATYGCKTGLKYPSCLIPIFRSLKMHVKITLPGWKHDLTNAISPESGEEHHSTKDLSCSEKQKSEKEKLPVADSSTELHVEASSNLQLSPSPTGQIRSSMLQRFHAIKKPIENCTKDVPIDLQNQPGITVSIDQRKAPIPDEPCESNSTTSIPSLACQQNSMQSNVDLQKVKDADPININTHWNGSLGKVKLQCHGLSFSSKCSNALTARFEVQTNMAATNAKLLKPMNSSAEVRADLLHATIPIGGKEAEQGQGQAARQNKVGQAKKELLHGMQKRLASSLAGAETALAVDVNRSPEKPSVEEQSPENVDASYQHNSSRDKVLNPLANAITSRSATYVQALQKRTRSVTRQERHCEDACVLGEKSIFHDSQLSKQRPAQQKNTDHLATESMNFVIIPSSQTKKTGPLTDHQKEVRRSQRIRGTGIKTYTSADFSQGDLAGTSEDFQESEDLVECLDLNIQLKVDEAGRSVMGANIANKQEVKDDNATVCQEIRLFDLTKEEDRRESIVNVAVETQPRYRTFKRELGSLDLKKRPLLRSSGRLRGGKNWRIKSEAEKAVSIAKLTTRGSLNRSGSAKRQKISEPFTVEFPKVNESGNFSDQLGNVNLPSSSLNDIEDPKIRILRETSDVLNTAVKVMTSYSPFKVQTLNRGFWVNSFVPSKCANRCRVAPARVFNINNIAAKNDSEDLEIAKNHHNKRKSNAPKKISPRRDRAGMERPQYIKSKEASSAKLNTPNKGPNLRKRRRLTGSPCSLTERAIIRALTPLKKLKTGRQGGRTYARRLSIVTQKSDDSPPAKLACSNIEDLINDEVHQSLQNNACHEQVSMQGVLTEGSKLETALKDRHVEVPACPISSQYYPQSTAQPNACNFLNPDTDIALLDALSDEINVCRSVERTSNANEDVSNLSSVPVEGKNNVDGSEVHRMLEKNQLKARDVLSTLAFSTMWDELELSDLLQVEAFLSIIGLKVAVCKARKVAARTNSC